MSEADSVSKKRDKEAGKSEYKEGYIVKERGGERERENLEFDFRRDTEG